ncbi:MAG: hypothetical protein NWE89_05035 [Candidatus Bathyarchaeota archaeon]|nr:hypothetical protein [Candidatus Bathyarchaeota archaeon]
MFNPTPHILGTQPETTNPRPRATDQNAPRGAQNTEATEKPEAIKKPVDGY